MFKNYLRPVFLLHYSRHMPYSYQNCTSKIGFSLNISPYYRVADLIQVFSDEIVSGIRIPRLRNLHSCKKMPSRCKKLICFLRERNRNIQFKRTSKMFIMTFRPSTSSTATVVPGPAVSATRYFTTELPKG